MTERSSPLPVADPNGLLRHKPLLLFVAARSFSEFAWQITTVAVGWQIYQLTGSAFYLGMVGLVQFVPNALLVFIAGHAADRYDRRRVVQLCQFAQAIAAMYLAARGIAGFTEMLKHYEAHSPLKRNVLPDELGATGTFLASDGAAAITGQVLYVDCGYQIMGM